MRIEKARGREGLGTRETPKRREGELSNRVAQELQSIRTILTTPAWPPARN